MSIVTLVSGGLDSAVVATLTKELGIKQFPLFVNYGQRARDQELAASKRFLESVGLGPPVVADLAGFGSIIRSGLTDTALRVVEDAFTPGRNLLFLLVAASYAYAVDASAIAIGLLSEETSLFPDQTSHFLAIAAEAISTALGRRFEVVAPLSAFTKRDVVALASAKGITGTYSCHMGETVPCGTCISCREFEY